jgi:hypothetical protein
MCELAGLKIKPASQAVIRQLTALIYEGAACFQYRENERALLVAWNKNRRFFPDFQKSASVFEDTVLLKAGSPLSLHTRLSTSKLFRNRDRNDRSIVKHCHMYFRKAQQGTFAKVCCEKLLRIVKNLAGPF